MQYTNIVSGAYYRDARTFTEVYRRHNIDIKGDCFHTMIQLPGVTTYGIGMQEAICNLIQAPNATVAYCQSNILAGKLMGRTCIWTAANPRTATLAFYCATTPVYDARLVWFKFVYRLLLTVYALAQLWRQYYRHYQTLFADLQLFGSLDSEFGTIHRYQVYAGDPTSVVLSDPVLSGAFQVDFFLSSTEMIGATFRTLQLDDLVQWTFGVLYCMRTVWLVFCGMRYGTFVIKSLRWEKRVVPLDTTLMTISTLVFATGVNFLFGNTRLLHSFGLPGSGYH
ncbi:hypothetical protein ACHHYP_01739 [Achlya hypogyna]|uniref:Transmembrane protein n=1 Tax=Achlya hypogyna TaxID=1202772 RepID=A0A1V9ZT75_ACHHY|nr:hypothetical protein ACHHYP_01739 [Achlya hypogyna]